VLRFNDHIKAPNRGGDRHRRADQPQLVTIATSFNKELSPIHHLPFGEEDRQVYQQELANVRCLINKLIRNPKVEVDGKEYKMESVMVSDMKALTKLMGFYTTYHPKAKWKCRWCNVCTAKLHIFSLPN